MPQHHGPRIHPAHELQQVLPLRVGGGSNSSTRQWRVASPEALNRKVSPILCGPGTSRRRIRVRVPTKNTACFGSPIMRSARSWAPVFSLIIPAVITKRRPAPSLPEAISPRVQHHQIPALPSAAADCGPVRPVRLQVIDFSEHAAEAADVNGTRLQASRLHPTRELREDLLGPPGQMTG